MSREIKFRVWDKNSKRMYDWESVKRDADFDDIVDSYGDWMQYTGLHDRNGKEIYEGDIVRYQFDNDDCPFPNKHTEKIIGRVFFSEWRASFSVTFGRKLSKSFNSDLFKYVRNGNRTEVIGNIYENPELLEGEHETD